MRDGAQRSRLLTVLLLTRRSVSSWPFHDAVQLVPVPLRYFVLQEDGFLFDGMRLSEGAAFLLRLRDDRALCRKMGEQGRQKVSRSMYSCRYAFEFCPRREMLL